jgi:hypothetical protein
MSEENINIQKKFLESIQSSLSKNEYNSNSNENNKNNIFSIFGLKSGEALIILGLDDKRKKREAIVSTTFEKIVIVDKKEKTQNIDTYEYNYLNKKLTKNNKDIYNQPQQKIVQSLKDFFNRNQNIKVLKGSG